MQFTLVLNLIIIIINSRGHIIIIILRWRLLLGLTIIACSGCT